MRISNYQALLKLPLLELVNLANRERAKSLGSKLELCSIINAKSGLCREDCKFCAQSLKYSAKISTYSLLEKDKILKAAHKAKEIGARHFGIVTSGNRLNSKELKIIAEAVFEIRNKVKILVCASLGALDRAQLKMLKESGIVRYHHNIETSPNFYKKIVSTHSFEERIKTVKAAKDAGLEVCSGGIIGMGEAWPDRLSMALILKDLKVDSIPLNILVPIKGTPLEKTRPIAVSDAIRAIAIFRIILKDKVIKVAAGRESVLGDFQSLGFMAGANGMLIGGYLTVKGRNIKEDYKLIRQIKEVWKK
ncbi:MAG: biotin synthase BioB [Candidatus Omnitrophica bacterium]|jgi:biotin synthase|nr:biotin synthase BioB [Candidatus Omnitrophota bacterium]